MKHSTLRLAGILVTVLVLGTVAFALAVADQTPHESQIPTVVTYRLAESTASPAPMVTPTPMPSSTPTKTAPARPAAPKKDSGSDESAHASGATSRREVVTPTVRDDGDGDDNGSGDGDSDNAGSSSGSHSISKKSDSPAIGSSAKGPSSSSGKNSDSINGIKAQSIDRPASMLITVSADVGRERSSGKKLEDTSN